MSQQRTFFHGLALTAMLLGACGARLDVSRGLSQPAQTMDARAEDLCTKKQAELEHGYNSAMLLIGAFEVTAADMVVWQETRHGPNGPQVRSKWRARQAGTPVIVCYFDGSFSGFPRPHRVPPPDPYERMVVLIDELGSFELDSVGYRQNIAIVRPTK